MNYSQRHVLLTVAVLLLASLACNTLIGGGVGIDPTPEIIVDGEPTLEVAFTLEAEPTDLPEVVATLPPLGDGGGVESEWPMPGNISNFAEVAGTTNFQTDTPIADVITFYQDEFGKLEYTERDLLHVVSDTTFSMVFDGHPSGQQIVVQGVDLGGSTNVNVSLRDVP